MSIKIAYGKVKPEGQALARMQAPRGADSPGCTGGHGVEFFPKLLFTIGRVAAGRFGPVRDHFKTLKRQPQPVDIGFGRPMGVALELDPRNGSHRQIPVAVFLGNFDFASHW